MLLTGSGYFQSWATVKKKPETFVDLEVYDLLRDYALRVSVWTVSNTVVRKPRLATHLNAALPYGTGLSN